MINRVCQSAQLLTKSAAIDRQRRASYTSVVPDTQLSETNVISWSMVIIGEHSNTRKRLAAVLLSTAVDEIALVDIMERHKTMKLITSLSMTELWRHFNSFITINSTTASPKTAERTVSMHSTKVRCYNFGSRWSDWHALYHYVAAITSFAKYLFPSRLYDVLYHFAESIIDKYTNLFALLFTAHTHLFLRYDLTWCFLIFLQVITICWQVTVMIYRRLATVQLVLDTCTLCL